MYYVFVREREANTKPASLPLMHKISSSSDGFIHVLDPSTSLRSDICAPPSPPLPPTLHLDASPTLNTPVRYRGGGE